MLALGQWGLRVPLPPEPTLSATSILLYLRSTIDPGERSYRVQLDDRVWTVRAEAGEVVVEPGEPADPDGSIRTDPATLNALLADPTALREAVAAGRVELGGDAASLITRHSRRADG